MSSTLVLALVSFNEIQMKFHQLEDVPHDEDAD